MKRCLGVVLIMLVAVAGLNLAPSGVPEVAAAPERPNIVVVMTDDQTVESLRVMPSTRHLVGERGATFANSYAVYPLCCPSRATFFTGQYAHNHGVVWNAPPSGGYQAYDGSRALPVALRQAGYHTAHVGKYLNGYSAAHRGEMAKVIPPGWADWHADLSGSYTSVSINHNGTIQDYGDNAYSTDVLGGIAEDVVRSRAGQASPFFLSLAFHAPHVEKDVTTPSGFQLPVPAPRHDRVFANEPLPRPPSFNEEDIRDKPRFIRKYPRLTAGAIGDITTGYREGLESLKAVDEAMNKLAKALRETGQLNNTVIVFTSDNGYFHGQHRIPDEKYEIYRESAQVPLLMSGPGIPAGVRNAKLVANIDLAPTILDLANADGLLTMDGRSLVPLLNNPGAVWRSQLLLETGPNPVKHWYKALATERYIYAEHSTGERELYDLANDPHQLISRHADAAYRPARDRLAADLQQLRNCAGASCFK